MYRAPVTVELCHSFARGTDTMEVESRVGITSPEASQTPSMNLKTPDDIEL